MKQPIKAISTVIELKPSKKYLLVFKTDAVGRERIHDTARQLIDMLHKEGITGVGVALRGGDEIEVIEAADNARMGIDWDAPRKCTCGGKSTIGSCIEHGGAWSYKCGACWEHQLVSDSCTHMSGHRIRKKTGRCMYCGYVADQVPEESDQKAA